MSASGGGTTRSLKSKAASFLKKLSRKPSEAKHSEAKKSEAKKSEAKKSERSEQVKTILVIGTTGSGKSETVTQLGGKHVKTGEPPEVSQDMESCTKGTTAYDIGVFDGARHQLVDTMGMLDTNGKDREGLKSIARVVDSLSTVVGVIYVVAGRMTPAEMETCNFLFGELFHDLPPSRLLVLRTMVKKWEKYDAEVDKKYLREQNGVPKWVLDANFVAVDFHEAYGQDALKKMTGRIFLNMKSWTTPVQLSNKSEIVVKYYTVRMGLKQLEEAKKELEAEKKNWKMKSEQERKELSELDAKISQENKKLQREKEKLQEHHPDLTKACDDDREFKDKVSNWDVAAAGAIVLTTGAVAASAGIVPAFALYCMFSSAWNWVKSNSEED